MDIRMVVQHPGRGYLTKDQTWSLDPKQAACYVSSVAFYDANVFGARVFLRFANGHEQKVSFTQMFERQDSNEIH